MIEQFSIVKASCEFGDMEGKMFVVVSPTDSNEALETVIIAPLKLPNADYPFRPVIKTLDGHLEICIDQIGSVHHFMILETLDKLTDNDGQRILAFLRELFS